MSYSTKLNGPELDRKWLDADIPENPTATYVPRRGNLYFRWAGTVISMVKVQVFSYTLITIVFYIIYASSFNSKDCDDDGLKCRPQWMDEQLAAISYTSSMLTHVTSFVLAFYLWQAYSHYQSFYWTVRAVQDRITNIAMSVGSSLNFQYPSQGSKDFAITFERYLNLVHFLCHAQTSPVLREFGWNKMQKHMVKEKIMGLQLVTDEEMVTLTRAYQLSGGQPGTAGGGYGGAASTVISWIALLFDEALTNHSGYFNDDVGKPRRTALSMSFQASLEGLREATAKLGYTNQLPMPMFYTQLMQLMVDVTCLLFPFTLVYEVNTDIVSASGFNGTNMYPGTLIFLILAAATFALVYQGLMCSAKCMSNPGGLSVVAHGSNMPSSINDKEMFVEVRSILNQTRASTRAFFNAGAFLPKTKGLR